MKALGFRALVLSTLALLLLSLQGQGQPNSPADRSKVATANPIKIFTQIQKTKDLRAGMKTRADSLVQQQTLKATEIKDLEAKRDLLAVTSPERAAIHDQVLEKTLYLQAWTALKKSQLEKEQKDQTVAVYRQVLSTIGKVATQRGIEIVVAELAPDIPEDLEPIPVQQLESRLAQRNILFTAAAADLTDAVITRMDADYKSGAVP